MSAQTSSSPTTRVAVLHQAIEPPVINGVRKPKKPGGYKDSGADIAYVLREQCRIPIITPLSNPDAKQDEGWTFPDTEQGILSAVQAGATHLWANTILFADHPLQTSTKLDAYADQIRIVGQPPRLVEAYDDKNVVNAFLRKQRTFSMPKSFVAPNSIEIGTQLAKHELELPVVAKPIRGRGSQGVKVCHSLSDLVAHIGTLGANNALLEEFLAGTEGTVTVMPPSTTRAEYWALPVVERFNHENGIAPYNGVVAVTANSRVILPSEAVQDEAYAQVQKECEAVAKILRVRAPIRVDVRKRREGNGEGKFVLFDVNMKPNMTAPGRPGREDQASLTALAAQGLGWEVDELLGRILETGTVLKELRNIDLPAEMS